MSSQVVSTDNATIIIQINPQVVQDSAEGQEKSGPYQNAVLKNFLKVQPKSLGTVQILTGIVIFLFGIVLSFDVRPGDITIFIGITYWGSLIYISAGSLSVAAETKLHSCVVKASLGMNVLSAITAGIVIIIISIQLAFVYSGNSYYYRHAREKGIIGILLLFSILQFIVSVCISAFACKATCDTFSSMVNISLNQGYRRRNLSAKPTTTAKEKLAEDTQSHSDGTPWSKSYKDFSSYSVFPYFMFW